MPLPLANQPWPPPELAIPHRDMAAWGAWWSGSPDRLADVYGGASGTEQRSFEQSWTGKGGLFGSLQRFFWGERTRPGQKRNKLHVPLAAEIAQVSADLLYGVPPAIEVDDEDTQEVLDRILGEQAHALMHEAAEVCSALGHVFYRVAIDREVNPDGPIVSIVDADNAFPRFRYGVLTEVTFVSEFVQGGVFWRHLEHHTPGLIEHALYEGDATNLGRVRALDDLAQTAELAPLIEEMEDGRFGIATQIDRLDVVSIPNAHTRTWRHLPAARYLGRADIAGVESELDALDDIVTSWMRDIRLGRSRLHVPANYLKSNGAGKGATFDFDEELYVPVGSMPNAEGGMEITETQFEIRYEAHAASADARARSIVTGAGYSPQTFGFDEASALTATESWARQVRTQNSRNAKVRHNRRGIIDLAWLVTEFDRTHFAGKGNPEIPVEVHFQETVSESSLARAQTAQLLSAARAASIKTLVAMQHPDWDPDRVDEEVGLIQEEDTISVPNPLDGFTAMENTPAADGQDPALDDPQADPATDPAAGQDQAKQ